MKKKKIEKKNTTNKKECVCLIKERNDFATATPSPQIEEKTKNGTSTTKRGNTHTHAHQQNTHKRKTNLTNSATAATSVSFSSFFNAAVRRHHRSTHLRSTIYSLSTDSTAGHRINYDGRAATTLTVAAVEKRRRHADFVPQHTYLYKLSPTRGLKKK